MIFISYNWDDDEDEKITKIALNIFKEFGQEKVFFDKEKNNIGDLYWENINKGLLTSDYFIFFYSKNYNNSTYCRTELTIAMENLQLGKIQKIIPIVLNNNLSFSPLLQERIYYKYDGIENTSNKIIESIKKRDFTGFSKEKFFDLIIKKKDEFKSIWEVKAKINIKDIVIWKTSKKIFKSYENYFVPLKGGLSLEYPVLLDEKLKSYVQKQEIQSLNWSIYDPLHFELDIKNMSEDFLIGFYKGSGSQNDFESFEFYNIKGEMTKIF